MEGEVEFPGGQGFSRLDVRPDGNVADVGKPLAAEEGFGHIVGRQTDGGEMRESQRRRFQRWLRPDRPGLQAEEPCCPRERHPPQEPPPAERSSVLSTHRNLPSSSW